MTFPSLLANSATFALRTIHSQFRTHEAQHLILIKMPILVCKCFLSSTDLDLLLRTGSTVLVTSSSTCIYSPEVLVEKAYESQKSTFLSGSGGFVLYDPTGGESRLFPVSPIKCFWGPLGGFLLGLSLLQVPQLKQKHLIWVDKQASFVRPCSFGVMSPTASLPASLCWRLLTLWTYHSSLMSTLLSHCGETPISLDLQTLGGQSHLNTAII